MHCLIFQFTLRILFLTAGAIIFIFPLLSTQVTFFSDWFGLLLLLLAVFADPADFALRSTVRLRPMLFSVLRGASIGWGFVRSVLLLVSSLMYGLLAEADSLVLPFFAPGLFAARFAASSFASSALCLAVGAFFVSFSLCPLHDLCFLGSLGFSVLGLVFFTFPFDPDAGSLRCVQSSLRAASYWQFNHLFCLFGPGFMWGARITGILTSVCNHLLLFVANILLVGKGQSLPRACGNLAFRRVARSLLIGLLIVGSIGYTSLPALSATSISPVKKNGSPRWRTFIIARLLAILLVPVTAFPVWVILFLFTQILLDLSISLIICSLG